MPELDSFSNSTSEPLILFFPESGKKDTLRTNPKAESLTLEYTLACPYKCRFTFDWDKFNGEADLVIVDLSLFSQNEFVLNSSE